MQVPGCGVTRPAGTTLALLARLKVHLQVCFYLIHLTPKSLFPKLSGHLWIVNNIVPFCLSPDHAHVSVHSCQMKREYNTILDDADSTNRNTVVPSQSFTWCFPRNFSGWPISKSKLPNGIESSFGRALIWNNCHFIIIIIILLLIKNIYYSRAGPRIAMLV